MAHVNLTDKDRSFAAAAGISGTPFSTPPPTPSRRSSSGAGETTKNETATLPRSAIYIIFVEGCERFCFYGLKTILLLYLMHFLLIDKDSATAGYHLFAFGCYFTPTIGAILSDGFIGRYWTILFLSVFYFIGTLVLTLTAIPSIGGRQLTGPIIGLLFIALGTGGIKPCVSAFGADQISTSNAKQLSRYFAFFYFAINLGSLISTIITPILRSKVHCFGYDCYSLAFGVPSVLVLIAITIFIVGTPLYKRVPPKENVILKFIFIISRAIRNSIFRSKTEKREHWLDHADDKHSANDINDIKSVLRVCMLFTPIPIYFALYEQSGSRWTYQASLMNGSLGRFGTIQPDQIQALNSLFVLAFIPLFEEVIYPAVARFNILTRPLQRMFCGMLLMALAFIVAALLQGAVQSKMQNIPNRVKTEIFNGYPCPLNVTGNRLIDIHQSRSIPCSHLTNAEIILTSTCDDDRISYKLSSGRDCPTALIISKEINEAKIAKIKITTLNENVNNKRNENGFASLRFIQLNDESRTYLLNPNKYTFNVKRKLEATEYQPVLPNTYRFIDENNNKETINKFQVSVTGVYTALIYRTKSDELSGVLFEDVAPATIHMLWQIIQYILLTSSEILVSITGLVFAYSQAPRRYKSVIMSSWLMTSAIGDLLVVFIANFQLVKSQTWEFVLFSGLMVFGAMTFGVLGIHYKETKFENLESEDQQLIRDQSNLEIDNSVASN